MKTLQTRWVGIRPLLMHNGSLADWQNPFTQKIKEITNKPSKKRTEADYALCDRLEWEGSLYLDDNDGIIVPSDNIERTIQAGGEKSRIGKQIKASVFCSEPHTRLEYNGGSRDLDRLYADGRFSYRKGVVISRSRVIRVRPRFNEWSITFDVEFDESLINQKALLKAMVDAGSLVGLGDFRPKFGRFSVEQL